MLSDDEKREAAAYLRESVKKVDHAEDFGQMQSLADRLGDVENAMSTMQSELVRLNLHLRRVDDTLAGDYYGRVKQLTSDHANASAQAKNLKADVDRVRKEIGRSSGLWAHRRATRLAFNLLGTNKNAARLSRELLDLAELHDAEVAAKSTVEKWLAELARESPD